ncbi:MAG: DUF3291 domain-containing protein [Halieaceae bacterium]|jgi:hypothetical protein|nr:DUF3291 domain-containing protein [Halieaceae bacterium]
MYQLAQLNIAQMRTPFEDPSMQDFVDNLDRINALADASLGFVWRLEDEEGNATAYRPFGDDLLVNLSVWEDLESLKSFVFQSAHADIMKRRGEWFDRMPQAYLVLWWVPAGHRPTEQEAGEKLELLRSQGPTPDAFTFREPFDPPA